MKHDALDELFVAPLDEFVATRNRIASELRKAGKREEAEQVKSMRKPPAVVWALNALARENRSGVARLVKAAETMRAVQSGRSRASFVDAQRALADNAWQLAREATELLSERGKRPPATVTQRLDRALLAAVASAETSEQLQAGRLTEEPETLGFAGIGEVVERKPVRADTKRADRERREAEERAADQRRREELAEAQRELRDAKAEAARLHREAERAQERVVRLEKSVARLRDS